MYGQLGWWLVKWRLTKKGWLGGEGPDVEVDGVGTVQDPVWAALVVVFSCGEGISCTFLILMCG